MSTYQVVPLVATQERAEIISTILRKVASHDTVFSDYQTGCDADEDCVRAGRLASDMCEKCQNRMRLVANALLAPHGRVWEVWENSETFELVGIMYFASIVSGVDAVGHYIFFDQKLSDKTDVIKEMIDWAFQDHDGWTALQRITVEIPDYAIALAKHAHRKLGFGGRFQWSRKLPSWKGREKWLNIAVEGVKEGAVIKDGKARDLLILGIQNHATQVKSNPQEDDPRPHSAEPS